MKRALSLLMAASLALGLAACGNNASTNDDANAAGDNNGASGSDKVWVIASDTVFKPFEYTDAEATSSASMSTSLRPSPKIRASSIRSTRSVGMLQLLPASLVRRTA